MQITHTHAENAHFQAVNKTQTSFFKNCFDNNIKLVSQLYNKEGTLFSYDEFLFYRKIPITQFLWSNLFRYTHMLCRGNNKDHSPDSASLDVTKSYIGKNLFFIKSQE